MAVTREIRRRAGRIWAPILGLSLIAYFAYHTVQGERGILAWLSLRQQLREAQVQLTELEQQKSILENRTGRLSGQSLDLDLLDERVRLVLNYTAADERVMFLQPPASPQNKVN